MLSKEIHLKSIKPALLSNMFENLLKPYLVPSETIEKITKILKILIHRKSQDPLLSKDCRKTLSNYNRYLNIRNFQLYTKITRELFNGRDVGLNLFIPRSIDNKSYGELLVLQSFLNMILISDHKSIYKIIVLGIYKKIKELIEKFQKIRTKK